MTGCAGAKETNAETKEVVKEAVAFPQAGEGSEAFVEGAVDVESNSEEQMQASESSENEATVETGKEDSKKNQKATNGSIKVATVGSPNIEILQQAGVFLAEKGYQLEIEVCEDYLTPNQKVVEGVVDCNYYQHEAFMERYNIEHQTTLAEVDKVYYEPMVILSKKIGDLTEVAKGMKVAVSNNPTAVARALWLLQDVELLTLMSDADMNTVKDDIAENPNGLEFVFVDENQLLEQLDVADFVVCAKGFAMQEAINIRDMLLAEEKSDSMMAQKLAQIIVAADAGNQKAKVLKEVLESEEMKQFIATKYQGSICVVEEAVEESKEAENAE